MTVIVILFIVGVVLIGCEVFLPGGIIGAVGAAMMIAGIVLSYSDYGPMGALFSTVVAVALVTIALVFEFKFLPKTRVGKRLFLSGSVAGSTTYSQGEEEMVGQTCLTVTALGPTGFVLLNGKKLEAASRSGFIDKNEEVKITGRDNFRIIVSKI